MNQYNKSSVGKVRRAHNSSGREHQHRANKTERFIYTIFTVIASALCIGILLFIFVFKIMIFTGDSMKSTLTEGDKLLVNLLDKKPAPGDIAVIVGSKGTNRAVKRVIATEGDTVLIDYENDIVYINNIPLDEPYILDKDMIETGDIEFPFTVPANSYFVLGDNRNVSLDSRFDELGIVPQKNIIGTVLLKYNRNERVKILEKTPIDTDIEEWFFDLLSKITK
ncbi:MAG: signal peptidase I [Clostridia bacterium]|nr:signal peptidase I [Clostridia bacterium]